MLRLMMITAKWMAAPLLAAAAPATPALAQASATASVDTTALEALNRDWLTAYKTRDVAALDRVLADDFQGIYPGGSVLTKADVLKLAANPERAVSSIAWENLQIKVFGDVALVTAQVRMAGTNAGKPFTGANDYADVYVKRSGTWRAISAHVVRLSP
jgi:ketosteroid isomerase-like protein